MLSNDTFSFDDPVTLTPAPPHNDTDISSIHLLVSFLPTSIFLKPSILILVRFNVPGHNCLDLF